MFEMMKSWGGLWQFTFLFIFLAAICCTIIQGLRYIAVMFKGWPPPGTPGEEEKEDD